MPTTLSAIYRCRFIDVALPCTSKLGPDVRALPRRIQREKQRAEARDPGAHDGPPSAVCARVCIARVLNWIWDRKLVGTGAVGGGVTYTRVCCTFRSAAAIVRLGGGTGGYCNGSCAEG